MFKFQLQRVQSVYLLQAGVKNVILTLGPQGAALCTLPQSGKGLIIQHLPAATAKIVNTNGAGDCLVAGSLAYLLQGKSALQALAFGMVGHFWTRRLQHLKPCMGQID